MRTFKFTTNIKCSACESKVRDLMDKEKRILSFKIDLNDEKRPLEVVTENEITENEVIDLVKQAGYDAKPKSGIFKVLFGV